MTDISDRRQAPGRPQVGVADPAEPARVFEAFARTLERLAQAALRPKRTRRVAR